MNKCISCGDKLENAWKKIGILYGINNKGYFGIAEDGQFHLSASFGLLIGILAEEIIRSVAEYTLNEENLNNFEKKLITNSEKIASDTARVVTKEHLIFEAEIHKSNCPICNGRIDTYDVCCRHCGSKINE